MARVTKRGSVVWNGRTYGRVPTALERRVLSLAEIPDTLDLETDRLFGAVRDWRDGELRRLASETAAADARPETASFTDIRPDQFTVPTAALYRLLRDAQQRVLTFAARQIRLELRRQGLNLPLDLANDAATEASV
mgnify:CR=1 FL=1